MTDFRRNHYRPIIDNEGDAVAASEPDDNTLDNAGPVGRDLADTLTAKVTEVIDGFPAGRAQRAAIARIVANAVGDYAEEVERSG